jgi:CRP-like cAMP-binding protein
VKPGGEGKSTVGNPWAMKMEQFTRFSDEDRRLLDELASSRLRRYEAREDLIREGEHSPDLHLVISGWACRYKLLPDGSRQIMAFLLPGDLCDAEIFILKAMDHSIATLAPSTVASIPGETMRELLLHRPSVAVALWWGTLTDEGVLRARIVDLGRRDARGRVAHLLYELLVRLRLVGIATGCSFELPITQADLADATGLTPVHVNRVLQRLREEALIATEGRTVTITDPAGLKAAAGFTGNHLHLERAGDRQDAVGRRAADLV